MTLRLAFPRAWPRGAMMALAILALVVKVLVPQGYMAAEHGDGARFPLVICTAQGRVTLDTGDKHAPPHKSKADSPCAFAGNVVPPAPSLISVAAFDRWSPFATVVTMVGDQRPGRGLAAPPPPAVGPPVSI
jgi:hypothetical protein